MSNSHLTRDVETLIAVFSMDPTRIEIYVEGHDDVCFLNWQIGQKRRNNVIIQEISSVKIPQIQNTTYNGNKAKALQLAKIISPHSLPVHFFLDADFDRILGIKHNGNIIYTDRRDLEGYFYSIETLNKIVTYVYEIKDLDPHNLLQNTLRIGTMISCCRIFSYAFCLKLPFQQTRVDKHIETKGLEPSLNLHSYVKALMQNANISLKNLDCYIEEINTIYNEFKNENKYDMLHGKDGHAILQKILSKRTTAIDNWLYVLRAAVDTISLTSFPELSKIVSLAR